MKIVVAGAWQVPWYQAAIASGFERAGAEVIRFDWWKRYFPEAEGVNANAGVLRRAQHKLVRGPITGRVQRELLDVIRQETPDILLAYQATHIAKKTLQSIRRISPGTTLASYNNDDPFSPEASSAFWSTFRRAAPDYDVNFVYRPHNLDDIHRLGGRAHLLLPYFIPERDYPEDRDNMPARFQSEVLFAGHYEDDGRERALRRLADAGIDVRIIGGGWEAARQRLSTTPLAGNFPVRSVLDGDYQRYLRGTKIALCFLSRKNRDRYTRRNFEIPANGTMCISEDTDELRNLFRDRDEIAYFHNDEELLDLVTYYLARDTDRSKIALAGYNRVLRDGHDNYARAAEILSFLENNDFTVP